MISFAAHSPEQRKASLQLMSHCSPHLRQESVLSQSHLLSSSMKSSISSEYKYKHCNTFGILTCDMTVCWIQGALDRSFPESLIIIFFIFCYKQGTPSPMTSGVIMTTAECQIARHVELSPLEKIEKQTVIRGFRHAVAKSGLSYGLTANSIGL